MKKAVFVLLMLLVAASWVFALEGSVTFMWYENDPNVEFFRYQLDGEEEDGWTVLDWSYSEVALDMDVSVPHLFYLQQSYDGEHWSESSVTESEVFVEEEPVEEPEIFEEELFEEEEEEEFFLPEDEITEVELDDLLLENEISIERYKSTIDLDFALGYMNHLPDDSGAKSLGFTFTYGQTIRSIGIAELAVRSNASVYVPLEFGGDFRLESYVNVLAAITKKIGRCDIFGGIGPEFGIGYISDTAFGFGIAAEAGVRYHRTDSLLIGFTLADHYLLAPTDSMQNTFDVRVFLSKEF